MNTHQSDPIRLQDEARLNVASLLMEDVGSSRSVEVTFAGFPLDEEYTALDTLAEIRLIRLGSGVLAQGRVEGVVEMECVRCLNPFRQAFSARFAEEFHQTVDVQSGRQLPARRDERTDDEDDGDLVFEIDDAHEIDMTELLRQLIVLELPMRPVCGDACPGPPPMAGYDTVEDTVDDRFAALQQLLEDE